MKWKFTSVLVFFSIIFFPFYSSAEFQFPEDPVKNIQTFTGCIKVWTLGGSTTAPNLRIITAPLQDCDPNTEIKVQFQANRISDLDPIGRVKVNGGSGIDLYKFSQYILNTARLNTTTASGRTPTNLELDPIEILVATGGPASDELNEGLLTGRIFDSIEISEMAIPGYGGDGIIPKLKVTLYNSKVNSITKIYGQTTRDQILLSFKRISWELQWFRISGGVITPKTYFGEYNTISDRVSGDHFGGFVTAYNGSQIVNYPDEFLLDYFEQNLSNLSANVNSELSFNIQKDVDPATIANLFALLNGQIIETFNINLDGDAFQFREVSVESIEIRFDAKASVMEKVIYRVAATN